MSVNSKVLSSILAAGCLVSMAVVPAHGKVTVTVGASAIVRGDPVVILVSANARGGATYCTYRLTGAKRLLLATKRVRGGKSALRYSTDSLRPGRYRATVNCGKAGRGKSTPFRVTPATPAPAPDPANDSAPAPNPTTSPVAQPQPATCKVVESGWTYRSSGGAASAGLRLYNSSTTNDATWVEVTVDFWSGGSIVRTESKYIERIPAGQSMLAGFSWIYVDAAITKTTSSSACDSEPSGEVHHVVGGPATAVATALGDIEVRGQFTNTYPFTLSGLARIDYVTRNAEGQINGGGSTYPDTSVAMGATRGWQTYNDAFSPAALPDSIEFTVEPEAD